MAPMPIIPIIMTIIIDELMIQSFLSVPRKKMLLCSRTKMSDDAAAMASMSMMSSSMMFCFVACACVFLLLRRRGGGKVSPTTAACHTTPQYGWEYKPMSGGACPVEFAPNMCTNGTSVPADIQCRRQYVQSPVMGELETSTRGQCPAGSLVRNLSFYTGEWGDVSGLYAECGSVVNGQLSNPFGAAATPATGAVGVTSAGPTGWSKVLGAATMGILNTQKSNFKAGSITDANQGFNRIDVVYHKDGNFLYDVQATTVDGRKVSKTPSTGYKVAGGGAGAEAGVGIAVGAAASAMIGGLGAIVGAGPLISRRVKQGTIKKQWEDYPNFARQVSGKEFKMGPTGDYDKPPDLSTWKNQCFEGKGRFTGRICKRSFTCPYGTVITGIDVGGPPKSTRSIRVSCSNPWASENFK